LNRDTNHEESDGRDLQARASKPETQNLKQLKLGVQLNITLWAQDIEVTALRGDGKISMWHSVSVARKQEAPVERRRIGTSRFLQMCSHTRGIPNLELLIFHSNLIGECFNACSRSCERFNYS
jgi:hypothetical protein